MLALGFILMIIAAGVAVGFVVGGVNDQATYDLSSLHVEMSTAWAFLLGALVLLLFVIGLAVARGGARRVNQRRKETKQLKHAARENEQRRSSDRETTAGSNANNGEQA